MTSLQKRAVVTAGANLLAAQGADLRQHEGFFAARLRASRKRA